MGLLRRAISITVIAFWLGHESVEPTMQHLQADRQVKERAMERARSADVPASAVGPADRTPRNDLTMSPIRRQMPLPSVPWNRDAA